MKFFKSGVFKTLIGILIGIAMIVIMFVSAFEIACYSDFGFYEKEYTKYDVNNKESIINMEMDELMDVTREMMTYLKGNREDLVIYATIDGTEKEMFNDIDKSHMADVRELFLIGLDYRTISFAILIVGILLLILTNGTKQAIISVCRSVQSTLYALWAVLAAIIVMATINFTAVFYAMHKVLFDNDNWLLDPDVSRLINMLPEGFFMDMGIRIAVIFVIINILIFFFCFFAKRGMIKSK